MSAIIRFGCPLCVGLILLMGGGCRKPSSYTEPPADSFAAGSMALELNGRSMTIRGASVGPGFFQVADVYPLLGRVIRPDEPDGVTRVAVLSERLWHDSLGSDRSLIGKAVKVDGQTMTVVGVMPAFFDSPRGAHLWVQRTGKPQ
jgi:hypothetical protein